MQHFYGYQRVGSQNVDLPPSVAPSRSLLLEVCVEGVESVVCARDAGIDRIELCANLAQGGTTPSIGDITLAVNALMDSPTTLHVLVRPRPGDFTYSSLELSAMLYDIRAAKDAGADGVVIGMLRPDGSIDVEGLRPLVSAAKPELSITFHRAFDVCTDPPAACLDALLSLSVDRILTSGRARSAWAGREAVQRLVEAAAGRITVMPGAGVSAANVRSLMEATGATEVHAGSACATDLPSPTDYAGQEAVGMGPVSAGTAAAGKSEGIATSAVAAAAGGLDAAAADAGGGGGGGDYVIRRTSVEKCRELLAALRSPAIP